MNKRWWHHSKPHTALFSFLAAAIILTAAFIALYGASNFIGKKNLNLAELGLTDAPTRLIIPAIAVDAAVQSVGRTASGRMGIPTNFTDVAWYNLGPKPGEAGSAVVDGHLDTGRDANAVFARLNELITGDEIDVLDETGKKIRFRVTAMEIYDEANAPLNKIFDQSETKARLNLITCDGVWNQKKRDYNKRLVVYSERVN